MPQGTVNKKDTNLKRGAAQALNSNAPNSKQFPALQKDALFSQYSIEDLEGRQPMNANFGESNQEIMNSMYSVHGQGGLASA